MFVVTINLANTVMILRRLALPIVSIVMVTILMASPLAPLLGKDYCTLIILGSSEEENNSHDTAESKVFDGKFFLLKNFFALDSSLKQEKQHSTLAYAFTVLEHTIEILDPPPKKLV